MRHASGKRFLLTCVLGAAVLTAAPLVAQSSRGGGHSDGAWPSRIAVTVTTGQFNPRGHSEAFRLFDESLSRGTSALTPRVSGGGVRVRMWKSLSVAAAFERGDRTVGSYSLVSPAAGTTRIEQQTRLDLTSVQLLGVQWQAWRWQRGVAGSLDRLRLSIGAGAGSARYSLRQWGQFVDESRLVAFSDDLASRGRGTFGYTTFSAEVPVTRWAALQLDARRQFGHAAMNGDFAGFDALDLSGNRFAAGVTFTPWR